MGGHIFLEYISFRMTCLMRACLKGGHALYEEISYGKSCIGGVHVFWMVYRAI